MVWGFRALGVMVFGPMVGATEGADSGATPLFAAVDFMAKGMAACALMDEGQWLRLLGFSGGAEEGRWVANDLLG